LGCVTTTPSPLRIAPYRRYWLAHLSSVMATRGIVVILGYQLYDVARTEYAMSIQQAAFVLGLLGLVQFVPLMLLTPVAGVLADRIDRRHVAGFAIILDMTIALVLALATSVGLHSLPLLFSLAALHGMARVFMGPAMSAISPNIVPAEVIPRAIATSSIAFQAGSIIGPAAAGFLFAHTPALPYWTAFAMMAGAGVLILSIPRLPPPRNNRDVHPVRQIVDGFRYVWNERFLLGCVTLDLFAVLLGGATALMPIFARDILHVGAEGLGQMRAAPALGAALVALWLSWRPLARNVGVKMLWSVAIYGAATVAFGLLRNFPLSLAVLALLGAADMVSVFVRSSLVQLNTPDDVRGRVSSISGLAISASNELGEMQSGIAAALLGATGAVVFGGAGAIFVTALWAWIFPELRNARTFAPQYRQKGSDT
jgi:MFS family permease